MVFGLQQQERLKNEIEGLQEEKDFFKSKYLEQVSEITALRESLKNSEREILRLRQQLMMEAGVVGTGVNNMSTPSSRRRSSISKKKKSSPRRRKSKEEEKKDDYQHDNDEHDDGGVDSEGQQHEAAVHHDEETISNLSSDDVDDDVDGHFHHRSEEQDDDDDGSEEEEEEDEDVQAAIRHKAEQLVMWASYRREKLSPSSSLSNKS